MSKPCEKARGPWRDYWQAQLRGMVLNLIDTLRGDVFQANEQVRVLRDQAALAGCSVSQVHLHQPEEASLESWANVVRREVGLPSGD